MLLSILVVTLTLTLQTVFSLPDVRVSSARQLQESMDDEKMPIRIKRKVLDPDAYPHFKWPNEIPFYIDSGFSQEQTDYIHRVIQEEFEAKTCLQFGEIHSTIGVTDHFMYFLKTEEDGCRAHVGRRNITGYYPGQPIYLDETCFFYRDNLIFGVAASLGMIFELDRPDRNDYVQILWDNVPDESKQYLSPVQEEDVDYLDVPYDLGSCMHHSARAYLDPDLQKQYEYADIRNDKSYSIRPHDGKLLRVMGQVSELSFYDAMALNKLYCSDVCSSFLQCSNGGYQDPNQCTRCICPDGRSGQSCNGLDEYVSYLPHRCTPHSGTLFASSDTQCVKSPGFGDGGYRVGDKCSWLLTAPDLKTIDMWFTTTTFEVANTGNICEHWVEIMYKGSSSIRGPRYCSVDASAENPSLPTVDSKLTSETSEVLVIFKSPGGSLPGWLAGLRSQGWFELCFTMSASSADDKGEGKDEGEMEKQGGLSAAIIAVIAVLAAVIVIIGIVLVVVLYKRHNSSRPSGGTGSASGREMTVAVTLPSKVGY